MSTAWRRACPRQKVVKAHQADVEIQDRYGVKYDRYWVDENAGKIFCLVDAPDADVRSPCPPRGSRSC
jgi:hypothetical protein